MTARLLNCTVAEYFRDPCEVPSLSQSMARTLIKKSPAHAWLEHPRLGAGARTSTKAQDDGTIIHALLLGKGKGTDLELIDADDYRTKYAQAARDNAIAAGRVPVIASKFTALEKAADRIRENILAYGIDLSGQAEVAVEWRETGFHGDVVCRCLMDLVRIEQGVIIDLKKIVSADLKTCSRHAIEYGYDIQYAAYTSALKKLRPDLAGKVDMLFLFAELEPPYAVTPARPSGVLRELGERRWGRAIALWEKCLQENFWPPYTNSITTIEAPPWALTQEDFDSGAAGNW